MGGLFQCKPGDIVENGWAGEGSPLRYGVVIRKFNLNGKLNPGPHVELTDGTGGIWTISRRSGHRMRVVGHVDITAAIRGARPTNHGRKAE